MEFVGWVERSETQHSSVKLLGYGLPPNPTAGYPVRVKFCLLISFSLFSLSIVCRRADKEKEQKKGHPCHLVLRTALRSSKLPGFCKLASLNGGDLCQCDMGCASTNVPLFPVTVRPSVEHREADKQCKITFGSFSSPVLGKWQWVRQRIRVAIAPFQGASKCQLSRIKIWPSPLLTPALTLLTHSCSLLPPSSLLLLPRLSASATLLPAVWLTQFVIFSFYCM